MNELSTQQQGTALVNPGGNYFQNYGDAVSQKSIVGKLLKFSKGDYLAGENDDEIAEGTKFVANMDELMVGWIRWADNKPTDQIMGRIAEGYQAPKRHELGDNDKSQWETDEQGRERDPWQFSNYLILKTPDGKDEDSLFTFTTSSRGGLNAIGELCKAYGKIMRQKPDEFPVIELGVDSYNHPKKEYGRIKVPTFKVAGWAPKADFVAALEGEKADTPPASEKPAKGGAKTRF